MFFKLVKKGLKKKYVGVAGLINNQEVLDVCREFNDAGYTMNTKYIPMIGFLVNINTLYLLPNPYKRYPLLEDIPGLLYEAKDKVLTSIHYTTNEKETIADQVYKIFNGELYENNLCRTVQLNIAWPDINQVAKIKEIFPEINIVFQLSRKSTKNKTHKDISEGIKYYGNYIDYVLIDFSGGRGVPIDVENSFKLYEEIKDKLPDVTIGFAGGLTGENASKIIKELFDKIGDKGFCIDAEGGLRDKITAIDEDDLLNISKVRSYLQTSYTELFS